MSNHQKNRHPIKPRGLVERSTTPKAGYVSIAEPLVEILAWCPDEKAEQPPTQVHLVLHWPVAMGDMPKMAVRFQSPDTLGFIIEELIKYRRTVWPDCQPVQGEDV